MKNDWTDVPMRDDENTWGAYDLCGNDRQYTKCFHAAFQIYCAFQIYRAALYNVYGGSRVTDVPYKKKIIIDCETSDSSMWGSPQ